MSMSSYGYTAQQLLGQMREGGSIPGFFRWLEELGREDKEVKEIDGLPMTFVNTGDFVISITLADTTTAQKKFTEQELRQLTH